MTTNVLQGYSDFVPKRQGNYKPGPGRDPFRKTHGEEGVSFKLLLTKSQYEYLQSIAAQNDTSIAEVIRALVDRARPQVARLSQERLPANDEGWTPPY